MRVAVVYYAEKQKELLRELSQALARGIQTQGVMVDVFNARDLTGRLTIYQYIALGTEVSGNFGGKIPEGGKRSLAFLAAKGLRKEKSLLNLMKGMESEGMFVSYSDIIAGTAAAESLGKTLDIQLKH